jgi:hypothetical protein
VNHHLQNKFALQKRGQRRSNQKGKSFAQLCLYQDVPLLHFHLISGTTRNA